MGLKPSFSVVAFALVVLALFGFMMERLRPRIPPAKENRLRFEKSAFLAQARTSDVDWRTYDPSTFAEARRTGKPILVLIGLPHGKAAREGDAQVFSDREVVSFLNRYMICVRIDGQSDPRWLSAFLPLRRAKLPMLTGFQLWFLTPEGRLYDEGGEIGTSAPISSPAVIAALLAARDRLREIREGSPTAPVPGAEQAADREALTDPAMPAPVAYREFESELRASARPEWGGFPRFGRIGLFPNVFRYLLNSGYDHDFRRLADGFVGSPAVDWLDGGFYRSITFSLPLVTEFDKSTPANAEMMAVLAKAGMRLDDPLYRQVARQAFDWLAGDAVRHGFVAGSRIGDERARNRSAQQSFSPLRLREVLNEEERAYARDRLGLRVETNPVMSVWISKPGATLGEPECARILAKLRGSRTGEFEFAGMRQLDVHGLVVARMLETARVLGDPDRLQKAASLFDRVTWFAVGDDVKHTLDPDIPDRPYLGDYLAYADASLQHFLAFGRPDVLESGLRVLRRARFLFATDAAGVWNLALTSGDPLEPPDLNVPEVLDFTRESCTSQAIRLCHAYGRLLRNVDPQGADRENVALSLCQAAASTSAQYSALSREFGLLGASYFNSCRLIEDDAHAVAVGTDAILASAALFRRAPTRLIAPAIGAVRPDLQKRPRGLYVIRGGLVEGPLSLDAAADRLVPVPRSP